MNDINDDMEAYAHETSDWEYVAEGRHHVLVRPILEHPARYLLRLAKDISIHVHHSASGLAYEGEAPLITRFLSPQYRPLHLTRRIYLPGETIANIDRKYVHVNSRMRFH